MAVSRLLVWSVVGLTCGGSVRLSLFRDRWLVCVWRIGKIVFVLVCGSVDVWLVRGCSVDVWRFDWVQLVCGPVCGGFGGLCGGPVCGWFGGLCGPVCGGSANAHSRCVLKEAWKGLGPALP